MELNHVYLGESLTTLQSFPADSIDALVCDPPAGISFMNKQWDNPNTFPISDLRGSRRTGRGNLTSANGFAQGVQFQSSKRAREAFIAFLTEVMQECLRVLKPGAHGLVWALPRTSHWTMMALEDAGFEVRDVIHHVFATGFPKSHNVSIALDKAQGAVREVVSMHQTKDIRRNVTKDREMGVTHGEGKFAPGSPSLSMVYRVTAPATDEAKQWEGWGTALKPSIEHWILVRKPLAEATVAQQVLATGTGAINIAIARVQTEESTIRRNRNAPRFNGTSYNNGKVYTPADPQSGSEDGRWPAHMILSHSKECGEEACGSNCPVAVLDEQGGQRKSGGRSKHVGDITKNTHVYRAHTQASEYDIQGSDGGAARFFTQFAYEDIPRMYFIPKSSRSDRTMHQIVFNDHPTAKSTLLMSWLNKLITPPGGIILDCFCGSGSTLVAAKRDGFHFIGIDNKESYVKIAWQRLATLAS